jgi:hypothetical protein
MGPNSYGCEVRSLQSAVLSEKGRIKRICIPSNNANSLFQYTLCYLLGRQTLGSHKSRVYRHRRYNYLDSLNLKACQRLGEIAHVEYIYHWTVYMEACSLGMRTLIRISGCMQFELKYELARIKVVLPNLCFNLRPCSYVLVLLSVYCLRLFVVNRAMYKYYSLVVSYIQLNIIELFTLQYPHSDCLSNHQRGWEMMSACRKWEQYPFSNSTKTSV